jgi:hypothetical protein
MAFGFESDVLPRYRRESLDPVGPSWLTSGAISHFSCRLHGRVESPWSSGSSTKRTDSLWLAHEASVIANANHRTARMFFRFLGTCASINHCVSRLHLDAARQTAGDDIADSGRRFNCRNSNSSNQRALPQNQHFRVRLDSLPGAEI